MKQSLMFPRAPHVPICVSGESWHGVFRAVFFLRFRKIKLRVCEPSYANCNTFSNLLCKFHLSNNSVLAYTVTVNRIVLAIHVATKFCSFFSHCGSGRLDSSSEFVFGSRTTFWNSGRLKYPPLAPMWVKFAPGGWRAHTILMNESAIPSISNGILVDTMQVARRTQQRGRGAYRQKRDILFSRCQFQQLNGISVRTRNKLDTTNTKRTIVECTHRGKVIQFVVAISVNRMQPSHSTWMDGILSPLSVVLVSFNSSNSSWPSRMLSCNASGSTENHN